VIKDVIDIDSDIDSTEGKKNIVKDYIISENIGGELLKVIENISNSKNKSGQIIGGYGLGKSHLLDWLVSILEKKELINEINDDDDVKKRRAFNFWKVSPPRDFSTIIFSKKEI